MLVIILLIIIGNRFYALAEDYRQNKWLYTVLSIVVFYGIQLIFGLILGMIFIIIGSNLESYSEITLNFIGLVIGIVAVFIFYELLKKKWEKQKQEKLDEIYQIGKKEE